MTLWDLGEPRRHSYAATARGRNRWRLGRPVEDWGTPAWIFDPLNAEFQFTLDPCASRASAKCERFFTVDDDGLSQPWAPETVFMNPPYGRQIPYWVGKAVREVECGATVVALLPASTDTHWWHDQVLGLDAEVRYVRGRPVFSNGKQMIAPSVIVIWRPS